MDFMRDILVYHWTAGLRKPNTIDLDSYQLLIGGDGTVYEGINPSPSSIAGLNSKTYNIALCGMHGYKSRFNPGDQGFTKIQLEVAWKKGAEVVKKYNIPIHRIFTHSVIGQKVLEGTLCEELNITSNKWLKDNVGKVDIDHIHIYPALGRNEILDLFRNKVHWYYGKV